MSFADRSSVTKIDTRHLPTVVPFSRGRKGTVWACPIDTKFPNSRVRKSVRNRFRIARKARRLKRVTYPLGNLGSITYMATVNRAIADGSL